MFYQYNVPYGTKMAEIRSGRKSDGQKMLGSIRKINGESRAEDNIYLTEYENWLTEHKWLKWKEKDIFSAKFGTTSWILICLSRQGQNIGIK